MRSDIDDKSILTNCSMVRIRTQPFSWITFQLDDSFDDSNRRFVRRIQEYEVREALKRMKEDKVMGPDGIPIEVWRSRKVNHGSHFLNKTSYGAV